MPTQQEIDDVGPWFQNIHFPDGNETVPGSHYPRCVWSDAQSFLPDLHDKSVLDIGCNGGFMEVQLEHLGGRVTAIDNNPKYVLQTALTKREFGLSTEVFKCNVEELQAEHRSWDIVLQLGVIYHVENPIRAMQNTIRAARELVIIETDIDVAEQGSKAQFFDFPEPYRYTWRPSLACMRKLIEYCGGILEIEHPRQGMGQGRYVYVVKPGGVEGVKRI